VALQAPPHCGVHKWHSLPRTWAGTHVPTYLIDRGLVITYPPSDHITYTNTHMIPCPTNIY
jgi:hypothetical protein